MLGPVPTWPPWRDRQARPALAKREVGAWLARHMQRFVIGMLVACLAATPLVSGEHEPLPSAADYEIRWLAPEEVLQGSPVRAAYMLVVNDDPLELQGHVNVELEVLFNGKRLVHSASIHEHDGFHGLTVQPPSTGTLEFVATTADGEARAAVRVVAYPAAEWPLTAANVSIQEQYQYWIVDVVKGADDGRAGGVRTHAGGASAELGFDALLEAEAGGLFASTWVRGPRAGIFLDSTGDSGTFSAFVTGTLGGTGRLGGTLVELPLADPGALSMYGVATPQPCDSSVVFDPVPANPGLVVQVGTDVRVAAIGAGAGESSWQLAYAGAGVGSFGIGPAGVDIDVLRVQPMDDHAQLTFRAPGPGVYTLRQEVGLGVSRCVVPMLVLPNDAAPGTVDALIEVDGSAAEVLFRPLDAAGAPIGHYEFDTRVFHIPEGTGQAVRLVWMGKLHGHDGPASFSLENLAAGDYLVRTHPSPQAPEAPIVVSDTGVFEWTFTVGASAASGFTDAAVDTPGLALPALLAALGVAATVVRRRP